MPLWQIEGVDKQIRKNDPKRYGLAPKIKDSFAELRVAERVGDYFCAVTTWPKSVSLKEYMRTMTPEEKDSVLPFVIVRAISALKYLEAMSFVHDNINPENIMIRPRMANGVPEVIITDLHSVTGDYNFNYYSLSLDSSMKLRYAKAACEHGYRPPEDYSYVGVTWTVDKRKRLSWMLGATIYAALTGTPPYGFTSSSTGATPWNDEKLYDVMNKVRLSKEHTFPPVKTSHNGVLLFLMNRLLTCSDRLRPTLSSLNPALLEQVMNSGGIKPVDGGNALRVWPLIKSITATVNPFYRHAADQSKSQ
ncbi:hypothetical protein THASP1DRAFT_31543 [Thamnocephalis sphaerospora]|uniref:Protein kinase domain-containing protein n=1 Tax=Thamnocephalis sphaerospora TaxID=78915 RepID=A0A4V1IW81_9FUNG|nr:hypothetical protein THASP1DRAFT_31543 [Thamnocephalis sphaerospora]|eukprot:RKP06639.1 hypothetical protein THASP1DRAFT_31543 [Thamnocephalis sphaerospora]